MLKIGKINDGNSFFKHFEEKVQCTGVKKKMIIYFSFYKGEFLESLKAKEKQRRETTTTVTTNSGG